MVKKNLFLFLIFLTLSQLLFAQQTDFVFNEVEDIEKGRKLQNLLKTKQLDSIYNSMSEDFQQAIKGIVNFKELSYSLEPKLGKKINILDEASFDEAGIVSYYEISRFENMPSVTFKWVWKDSTILGLSINPTPEPAESQYQHYQTKTELYLPFEGSWYTAWGGNEAYLNKHVQSSNQRFAFDFLKANDGKLLKGDKRQENSDFYSYGAKISAPGKGVVVTVLDTVHDNNLGQINEKVPPGNHVVIDHQNGEYSFLAHFKKGSIKVQEGDKVQAGDLIGLAGNSGRSDVPHLHYHLQTEIGYNEGEGLPIQFTQYVENGQEIQNSSPQRGYFVSNNLE